MVAKAKIPSGGLKLGTSLLKGQLDLGAVAKAKIPSGGLKHPDHLTAGADNTSSKSKNPLRGTETLSLVE